MSFLCHSALTHLLIQDIEWVDGLDEQPESSPNKRQRKQVRARVDL